jgi:hypothetical protein
MHWREPQRYETPLAVRGTGVTVGKLWLAMLAAVGAILVLTAVLA